MTRVTLSTHVLDVALGKPAAGVRVTLSSQASRVTDADGRIADLTSGGVDAGSYELVFDLDPYFGNRPHIYRKVVLTVELAGEGHQHVPLLIAPFSCTTYRGS